MYRKEVIRRLVSVEVEHHAAHVAVRRMISQSQSDPTILHGPRLEPEDLRRCAAALEHTYLVRMFAVFEGYLRTIWRESYHRDTHPPVHDLIAGCASHEGVPYDYSANAHRVRLYRNAVVHDGDADVVSLADAREYLCVFFSWMPPEW